MNAREIKQFQKMIWEYYKNHKRSFSWRDDISPYRILVSEIMLQQTQTSRVDKKFEPLVKAFPNFDSLAKASFHQVLVYWQGLGYNRRALSLHKIAAIIMKEDDGQLPKSQEILKTLPDIGAATAASICAFAYNMPTVFLETNIRSVFIHSFFQDKDKVSDKELMPFVAKTIDKGNPREWYYALMDYGVFLKQTGNPNHRSKHYVKQSVFHGSNRYIRGMILKALTKDKNLVLTSLAQQLDIKKDRIIFAAKTLCKDGFTVIKDDSIVLS